MNKSTCQGLRTHAGSTFGSRMRGAVSSTTESVLALAFLAVVSACSAVGAAEPDAIRSQLDIRIPEVFSQGNAPSLQVAVVHAGRGLGLYVLRDDWFGSGGSSPGFQCLARFNPSREVGYVILTNVNAILGGGDNYASARGEIYSIQDALYSVLSPWTPGMVVGLWVIPVAGLLALSVGVSIRKLAASRRRMGAPKGELNNG